MNILFRIFIFIVAFISLIFCYNCRYCQPEQTHLSFGEKPNDIVVTWTTFTDTGESVVKYGEREMDRVVTGNRTLFTDGGFERRQMWIHRVTLTNLKFNTSYIYHAGSKFGWSEEFFFKTPPAGEAWVLRGALYGDMGNINAHSIPYLQDDAQRGLYDVILHVGDFAYDLDSNNALVGDQFMRQIQPIAAYVPYMTCPGNHEAAYNFSNYKNRFTMPGGYESMMYSWDLGPVHFISISTEFYYFLIYGRKMVENQYYWLIEDLKKATLPVNREKRPWIVLYGHRPMYCSNSNDNDCKHEYIRTGLPTNGLYGLEVLIKEYGVDLVVWAHEHSYERTWPLYNQSVYNGSYDKPYHNPRAPIHLVTGSAGCQEKLDPFLKPAAPWSAVRISDYGYTKFFVHNKTHMHLQQISATKSCETVDDFWIVKDKHERYDI